jgi:hypothetical protein
MIKQVKPAKILGRIVLEYLITITNPTCPVINRQMRCRVQVFPLVRLQTNPSDKQQNRTIPACGCEIYYQGSSWLELKVKARLYDKWCSMADQKRTQMCSLSLLCPDTKMCIPRIFLFDALI